MAKLKDVIGGVGGGNSPDLYGKPLQVEDPDLRGPNGKPAAPLKVAPVYVQRGETPRVIQQHERAIPGSPERRWKVWGNTFARSFAPVYVLATGKEDAVAVFVRENELADDLAADEHNKARADKLGELYVAQVKVFARELQD